MSEAFVRTELLLGAENMERLKRARVAVFGVGGVGGYVVEALARSGVGSLDLIDDDVVAESNLNRQIIALRSTLGRPKVEAAAERVHDINPNAVVRTFRTFYLPETAGQFDFREYDYVVDAIDTVTGKLLLAEQAKAAGTPIISSMGAGNKLNPAAFEVADIYETSVCPLAKVMRRELKKRGIDSLKVVYSKEPPLKPGEEACVKEPPLKPGEEACAKEPPLKPGEEACAKEPPLQAAKEDDSLRDPLSEKVQAVHAKRQTPGSIAFVPAVAGLILAGEVIRDLSATVKTKAEL